MNITAILKSSLKEKPATISAKRFRAYQEELARLHEAQKKKAKRAKKRKKSPASQESAREYSRLRKQEAAIGQLTSLGKELAKISKELECKAK